MTGSAVKGRADDLRTERISVGGIQLFAVVKLQMRRQREHKKTIYRDDRKLLLPPAVAAIAGQRAKTLDCRSGCPLVLMHIQPEADVTQ